MRFVIDEEGDLIKNDCFENDEKFRGSNLFQFLKERGVSSMDTIRFKEKMQKRIVLGAFFMTKMEGDLSVLSTPVEDQYFDITLKFKDDAY